MCMSWHVLKTEVKLRGEVMFSKYQHGVICSLHSQHPLAIRSILHFLYQSRYFNYYSERDIRPIIAPVDMSTPPPDRGGSEGGLYYRGFSVNETYRYDLGIIPDK